MNNRSVIKKIYNEYISEYHYKINNNDRGFLITIYNQFNSIEAVGIGVIIGKIKNIVKFTPTFVSFYYDSGYLIIDVDISYLYEKD